MLTRRTVAIAYIVAPGALAAAGILTDSFGLFIAGLVLGLPLSYVGNILTFLVAATASTDATDVGAGAAALAAALYAVTFSGRAAIQALIVRALLDRRRRGVAGG